VKIIFSDISGPTAAPWLSYEFGCFGHPKGIRRENSIILHGRTEEELQYPRCASPVEPETEKVQKKREKERRRGKKRKDLKIEAQTGACWNGVLETRSIRNLI